MDYQETLKRLVWAKGAIVPGYDPNAFRKDVCGAWMAWAQYGNRQHDTGWEIDHIVPVARNGSENLVNLRPLHWKNNASKQDGKLVCAVFAARG